MKRVLVVLLCMLLGEASAEELWRLNIGTQMTALHDVGSLQRVGTKEYGVLFSGDYLDDGGFTLGYTRTAVEYVEPQASLHQRALLLSLREQFYADSVPGVIKFRADGHRLKNDDEAGLTNEVRAWAAQLGYLGNDKQHYFDLSYARSSYPDHLTVDQYAPTLGFALQSNAAWLQLRGYFIRLPEPMQVQGDSHVRALEAKYTYWLTPDGVFTPDNIQLGALYGKTLYRVDMDAAAVIDLADLQKGGVALGAEWRMGKGSKLLLLAGQNRYENYAIGNNYRGNFLYLNLDLLW